MEPIGQTDILAQLRAARDARLASLRIKPDKLASVAPRSCFSERSEHAPARALFDRFQQFKAEFDLSNAALATIWSNCTGEQYERGSVCSNLYLLDHSGRPGKFFKQILANQERFFDEVELHAKRPVPLHTQVALSSLIEGAIQQTPAHGNSRSRA